MTAIMYDPIFLEHDTGFHPEKADRLKAVVARLESTGLWEDASHPDFGPATEEEILRVHSPQVIELVKTVAAAGGGNLDLDTVVSARSYDAAMMAAGACLEAVRLVTSGAEGAAFCAVRPPGHHATREKSMGFCLFNNAAVAAAAALAEGLVERIAVVDWDIHHGNGTQDAFYSDGRVFYLSSHMSPHYPGTGRASETGSGEGAGTTLNIPVAPFTSAAEQVKLLADAIGGPVAEFRPQLVIISAGYDSAEGDPLGALMLRPEDFRRLTELCVDLARAESGGVVATLEGGYELGILARGVEETVGALMAGG